MDMTVSVHPPGKTAQGRGLESLLNAIRTYPNSFWDEGTGSASVDIVDDAGRRKTLTMVPDRSEDTFYLKAHEFEGNSVVKTWLSLGNRDRLGEVFEVDDDYQASKGLFVSPNLAAECVQHFAVTGGRSTAITWIRPADVPPDGNY